MNGTKMCILCFFLPIEPVGLVDIPCVSVVGNLFKMSLTVPTLLLLPKVTEIRVNQGSGQHVGNPPPQGWA